MKPTGRHLLLVALIAIAGCSVAGRFFDPAPESRIRQVAIRADRLVTGEIRVDYRIVADPDVRVIDMKLLKPVAGGWIASGYGRRFDFRMMPPAKKTVAVHHGFIINRDARLIMQLTLRLADGSRHRLNIEFKVSDYFPKV